jgi:hypothetical protein
MDSQRNIQQNRDDFAPPKGPLWARIVLAFRPLFSLKLWALFIGAFLIAAVAFGFFGAAKFVGGMISGLIEGAASAPDAPIIHTLGDTVSQLIDLAVATAVVGAITIIVWRR